MKMALRLGQHHLLKSPFLRLATHTSERETRISIATPTATFLLQAQITKTRRLAFVANDTAPHLRMRLCLSIMTCYSLTFQLGQGHVATLIQASQDGTFVICVSNIFMANE